MWIPGQTSAGSSSDEVVPVEGDVLIDLKHPGFARQTDSSHRAPNKTTQSDAKLCHWTR